MFQGSSRGVGMAKAGQPFHGSKCDSRDLKFPYFPVPDSYHSLRRELGVLSPLEHVASTASTLSAGGKGHQKAGIISIYYRPGSNELYFGNANGKASKWDLGSGQLDRDLIDFGRPITCMAGMGDWLMTGIFGAVCSYNVRTQRSYSLDVLEQQGCCSLATSRDTLYAGLDNGKILTWKLAGGEEESSCPFHLAAAIETWKLAGGEEESSCPFHLAAAMEVHASAIVSLAVAADRLFSGTVDGTIGVCDVMTLQRLFLVSSVHAGQVTSLIPWYGLCLSSSLDGKIKVWDPEMGMRLEHEHRAEHGILAMTGLADSLGRQVLVCSMDDGTVCWYKLPYFRSMGFISNRGKVWAVHPAPDASFFAGDTAGDISEWKC